jgi:hypothetical protein
MNSQRDIAPPERRADGSWRYPVQVVIQSVGKWQGFGHARFEIVGYAADLTHQRRLQECLR